jgi:GTP cyclohydrolase I
MTKDKWLKAVGMLPEDQVRFEKVRKFPVTDTNVQAVKLLLDIVDPAPTREGLSETPARFLKSLHEQTTGYLQDPAEVFKVFEDGAAGYDSMVLVQDLPFYSLCEHHLAQFFGTATIAYLPQGKVVGLSKLGRVVDIFARRLQVQERLTTQIADCIQEHLQPKGVGVVLKARHMCMEARGYSKQGHQTITSALRGEFLTQPEVRAEFMSLATATR